MKKKLECSSDFEYEMKICKISLIYLKGANYFKERKTKTNKFYFRAIIVLWIYWHLLCYTFLIRIL